MSQNIIGSLSPNSYRLITVSISNNEGDQWDVTNLVDSWELNENIYNIFLEGSMTMVDNIDLFNRINFTSQEYVRLHFAGVHGDGSEQDEHINQVFRIYNLKTYMRETELDLSKQMYSFQFCSPLLYEAKTKRISQHFSGTSGQIIEKIFKDNLFFPEEPIDLMAEGSDESASKPLVKGGKELGLSFSIMKGDAGSQHNFVSPNWTVKRVLEYLRDHTSVPDENNQPYGNSFYLYQTASKGFRFHNITSMMELNYFKDEFRFELRDNVMENSATADPQSVQWDILNYNKNNMYHTINNHTHGLYASNITNYNTVTKQLTVIDSEFTSQFKLDDDGNYKDKVHMAKAPPFRLQAEGIRIPKDGGFEYGIKAENAEVAIPLDPITKRYDSAIAFDYSTPHMMSDVPEVTEGVSDSSISDGETHVKVNRERVETLLKSNRINIMIPARTDISCGEMINVNMVSGIESTLEEIQHQGRLLIEGITWTGNHEGLRMNLSCTTDGFSMQSDTLAPRDRQD